MRKIALAFFFALSALPAHAGSTQVAVAANFAETAAAIAAAFKAATGHEAVLTSDASGVLYAQILQGAPYEVFLSADQDLPIEAAQAGLALDETRFTYAVGSLVLWSRDGRATLGDGALRAAGWRKLAISNPVTSPYGKAAVATLKALNLHNTLASKITQGGSVAQSFELARTGKTAMAFVALSQVITRAEGGRWLVPPSLAKPMRQDAALLKNGEANEAARAFMTFLKGPDARSLIEFHGYEVEGAR